VIPSIEMTPSGHRPLPHNLEAEQSVIGSLLLDRDAIIAVSQSLRPDDFYLEAHRTIYGVMVDLYEKRQPADYVTITDELDRRDMLDRVGGRGYLPNLAAAVPTAIHAQYYAEIVSRLAVLRRLIDAGQRIVSVTTTATAPRRRSTARSGPSSTWLSAATPTALPRSARCWPPSSTVSTTSTRTAARWPASPPASSTSTA